MKKQLVSDRGSRRLILLFAGWGMDASVFNHLHRDGYDIAVVYDYTERELETDWLVNYDEIVVVAWSMGVYFADIFISTTNLPITKCIAINGTLCPIDDHLGIPEGVYDKTSILPDRRSVEKFYRRICGGEKAREMMMPQSPARNVDDLRQELLAIRESARDSRSTSVSLWDEVIISTGDLIFPPDNMKLAWNSVNDRITLLDGAHLIDFQKVIETRIVDKGLVGDKFASASDSYLREAQVQMQVARRLYALMEADGPVSGRRILEVGSGCGNFTRLYQPLVSSSSMELWDLSPSDIVPVNGNSVTIKAVDAEAEIVGIEPRSFDIVVSASTLQWFNSPRRFVRRVVQMLGKGGRTYFAYYGKGTFSQLGDNYGLRYYDVTADDLSDLNVEVSTKSEKIHLEFATPVEALRHLRLTGVNALRRNPLGVRPMRMILDRLALPDGSARLTFKVNYITILKK